MSGPEAPASARRTGSSERRPITVLFADIAGSTAIAERMDPEDWTVLVGEAFSCMTGTIERYDGTIARLMGDGVLAFFGAPVAHEDDPERAVRAALAIRDFAIDDGLELRVGITTGEALVSLSARPAEGEGMASGDVGTIAAALDAQTIGRVIVSTDDDEIAATARDYGAEVLFLRPAALAAYIARSAFFRIRSISEPSRGASAMPILASVVT